MPSVGTIGTSRGTTRSAVTPYRETHLRFDVTEASVSEPPYALFRGGADLLRSGLQQTNSLHLARLASGALALSPYQQQIVNIRQQADVKGAILGAGTWTLASTVQGANTWRAPSDLSGVDVSGVQANGDPFLTKSPTATVGAWNDTSLAADLVANPRPSFVTSAIPLERHAISNAAYPAGQPFVVRVDCSHEMHIASSEIVFLKIFGGPLSGYGRGIFCLVMYGSGEATLSELSRTDLSAAFVWYAVDKWRYAPAGSVAGHVVLMEIWPHQDPNLNGYLQFRSATGDESSSLSLTNSYFNPTSTLQTHLYRIRGRKGSTGEGNVRVDMVQDRRTPWQISRHIYQPSGWGIDGAFTMPWGTSTAKPITLSWQSFVPVGTTLDLKVFDANTNVELTVVSTGNRSKIYTLNVRQPNYYVKAFFTANAAQTLTPILWSYKILRDGVQGSNAPGEFGVPSTYPLVAPRRISITGPERDPSHETAAIHIEDPAANLTVLNTRAMVRSQVNTLYDSVDRTSFSVLMDGYATRNDALRKGSVGKLGLSNGGGTRLFPSPNWRSFQSTWLGMWARLERARSFFPILPLLDDGGLGRAADGTLPGLKVTDVVRAFLQYCGFTADQVNVPDSPIRFATSTDAYSAQQLTVQPLAAIAALATQYLRDFLGWFLVWDGNAGQNGSRGMWRALRPSVSPYNNLAAFTTLGPAGKFPHRPESYGTTNWTGVNPTGFIRKGTLETYVDAPEANAVCVSACGEVLPNADGQFRITNWALNLKSYDPIPGHPTSDPTNPDYLGFFSPLIYINTALGGASAAESQHRVDIICRRLFDISCHAIKRCHFDAPLLLVTDPTDSTLQVAPRPLRYYDAVTVTDGGVTSQWLVRSCNPTYVKDSIQLCRLELESPRI